MIYVADTHAWIYYLLNKLPIEAEKVFSKVEAFKEVMFIPTICLNECIYLIEKDKIKLNIDELFLRLEEAAIHQKPYKSRFNILITLKNRRCS